MSDDKKTNDNSPFSSLLKGLQESADGFLKNLNQSTSDPQDTDAARQARKDRYKEMEKTIFGTSGDAFERVYQGVRDSITARRERTLPAHEELPNLPEQKIHVHDNRKNSSPAPEAPSPTSPTAAPLPPLNGSELVNKMSSLLQEMSPSSTSLASDFSWHALDQLSAAIRTAWVGVLGSHSSAPDPRSGSWLDQWEDIVTLMSQSVNEWPQEHQASWSAWAQSGQKEVQVLRPLLAPASASNFLAVPSSFQGKGVIPTPPPSAPKDLVKDLQNCADFLEFYQSSDNARWKNTPSKYAFEECKGKMEQWSPTSEDLLQWKDKALDRYTLIEAKIAISGARSKPSSTPPRSKKP